jgi:hypothetical protein
VENARLMIPSLVQAQQLNEDQTQELRAPVVRAKVRTLLGSLARATTALAMLW